MANIPSSGINSIFHLSITTATFAFLLHLLYAIQILLFQTDIGSILRSDN